MASRVGSSRLSRSSSPRSVIIIRRLLYGSVSCPPPTNHCDPTVSVTQTASITRPFDKFEVAVRVELLRGKSWCDRGSVYDTIPRRRHRGGSNNTPREPMRGEFHGRTDRITEDSFYLSRWATVRSRPRISSVVRRA